MDWESVSASFEANFSRWSRRSSGTISRNPRPIARRRTSDRLQEYLVASNRDREDCSDVTKTGIRTRRAAVVIDWPRRWNVPRNRSSNHQKAMSHTLGGH